jgi:mono/diheme cytochrome c family protein
MVVIIIEVISCLLTETYSLMKTVVYLFLLLMLFSCTAEKKPTHFFTTSNLSSFYITVDPTKDVVFNTPKGAAIKIRKGTFNEAVELEIKEAYSMKDILLAGLTTQSNGQPMTSGGMIYINTKDKRDVKPSKPISVALPTAYVNEDMQLFKGEEQADGSVNWVNPDSLPATAQTISIEEGRQLFEQNCRTCHELDRNLTGPALRGFTERGPWRNRRNLYSWIHNPAAFMARDRYTKDLKAQYGVIMQAFPQLNNKQIDAIAAYVNNAQYNPTSEFNGLVLGGFDSTSEARHYSKGEIGVSDTKLCPDTTYYYPSGSANSDTIPLIPVDTAILNDDDDTISVLTIDTGVDNPSEAELDKAMIPDGTYQFEINSLGWYNIDALLKDIDNTVPCDITVQVKANGVTVPSQVYLFLPRHKILHNGTPTKDGIYRFEAGDGKMPLYLGAEAVVLAIGNQKDQLYVGTVSFHVQTSQRILIELKPSTSEELLQTIKEGKLEGVSLDIIKRKMSINYYPCDVKRSNSSAPSAAKGITGDM